VLNWIICDGDIDPEWIESLNSVLDDNHLLTLPTGERISFGDNVNFIFEADNLQYASPATVSRMGMIFLNNEDINIVGILTRWVSKYGNDFISQQVTRILDVVNWLAQQNDIKEIVGTTQVGLVRSVLSQLSNVNTEGELQLQLFKGLASNYDDASRREIFKKIYQKEPASPSDPLGVYLTPEDKLKPYEDESTQLNIAGRQVILTKELKRDLNIIKPWLKRGEHFIVVGKEGCGKSILVDAGIA
jgi:dynein heavy chain 2